MADCVLHRLILTARDRRDGVVDEVVRLARHVVHQAVVAVLREQPPRPGLHALLLGLLDLAGEGFEVAGQTAQYADVRAGDPLGGLVLDGGGGRGVGGRSHAQAESSPVTTPRRRST